MFFLRTLGFVSFLGLSFFLSWMVYFLMVYLKTGEPAGESYFLDTYVFFAIVSIFAIMLLIQLFITPVKLLVWWSDQDVNCWCKKHEGKKFNVLGLSLIVCLFIFAVYPSGTWGGASVFRAILTVLMVVVLLWLAAWLGKPRDAIKYYQYFPFKKSDKKVAKNKGTIEIDECPRVVVFDDMTPEKVKSVFFEDKFKCEMMLETLGNICFLREKCDEIEKINSVADDNLRKVVDAAVDIFSVLMDNPERLNDEVRRTLNIYMSKVISISKNLIVLLQLENNDLDTQERIQNAFVKFEGILKSSRDGLFSSELGQLTTDLSMLESDMEQIDSRQKINSLIG